MNKTLEELLNDVKFTNYKAIIINKARYEPDEIEYYQYIFLDFSNPIILMKSHFKHF